MSEPIQRVSASKYPGNGTPAATPPPHPPGDSPQAFPVKFKLKGAENGPVYAGQAVVVPCIGCGKMNVG